MTGSTTMCFAPYSFNFAAIVSISSAEDTMPILTASGKMSVNTASSCSARKCGVESKMSVTPVVFWAVRAVTAHRAKTPLAVMVLMSAWIPAPPLESLPAMVNAVLMVITSFPFYIQQGFIKRHKVVPPVYRWGMVKPPLSKGGGPKGRRDSARLRVRRSIRQGPSESLRLASSAPPFDKGGFFLQQGSASSTTRGGVKTPPYDAIFQGAL